jgi:hypothetical protein
MVTSVNVSGLINETQVNNQVDEVAVRHDVTQTITDTGKARARTNIGLGTAATASTVDAVTNGEMSPITSNAVFDGLALKIDAYTAQTANTFLAAPNGSSGTPTFRAVVAADVPTLNQSTTGSAATLTTTRSITMTGDVTWTVNFDGSTNVSAAGTIANSAVTNAKLANMVASTFKGRVTGSTGVPEDMTATQATSLLNVFTSSLKGLVPSSGGGTTSYLRADGSFTSVDLSNAGVTGTLAAASFPALTGAITTTAGNLATTLSDNAVTTVKITDANVTLAKMANIATRSLLGRSSAGSGVPQVLTGSTLKSTFGMEVNLSDFGAIYDGTTETDTAFAAAKTFLNSVGGGVINITGQAATYTGYELGNGTNSAQSTTDHSIIVRGIGGGAGADITNTNRDGPSAIVYRGAGGSGTFVARINGPIVGACFQNIQLHCRHLAEIGLISIHATQQENMHIVVRDYKAKAYHLTSRDNFPSGCAYGNADNRWIGCYSSNPYDYTGIAIHLSSGVSTSNTLAGYPDTARNIFIGGTFIYGGNANGDGVLIDGADNNAFIETQFVPKSGSSGGYDVRFTQWSGSTQFPLENYFANLGMTRGVGGTSGTGGNTFNPYQTSDGATWPTGLAYINSTTQDARTEIQGIRAWRARQVLQNTINSGVSTNSTTPVDVTGLVISITTIAGSRLKFSYSGRAIKDSSGNGFYLLNVDGITYGPSQSSTGATGYGNTVTGSYVLDGLTAGSHTVSLKFYSSDSNNTTLLTAVVTVEELW